MSMKKKLTSVAICAAMIASSASICSYAYEINMDISELFSASEESDSSLSETPEVSDVTVISTADELSALAARVNSGEETGGNYKLVADIDLSGTEWTPIGTDENPFVGTFDGDGHTISGLKITKYVKYAGLFGYVKNSSITNLALSDLNIYITDITDFINVGGLAGYICADSNKTVSNISQIEILGSINIVSPNTNCYIYAGALFGNASSSNTDIVVSDSRIITDVKAVADNSTAFTGLVSGKFMSGSGSKSKITSCYVKGSSYAKAGINAYSGLIVGNLGASGPYIGGNIASMLDDVTVIVTDCFSEGTTYASGALYVSSGAVVGNYNEYAGTSNCYYSKDYKGQCYKKNAEQALTNLGTSVDAANLADSDFLSRKLGFDMENVWTVDSKKLIPALRLFYKAPDVSDVVPGDIFEDGEVNSLDAIKLAQQLSGWALEFTDRDKEAADVYDDGEINSLDAIKLAQYLSGWDITLG